MLDPSTTTVIVNPAAAGGKVGRRWGEIEPQLRRHLGEVRFQRTERTGHAIDLARAAVQAGQATLLSLGGDGTHNEVVNGIMEAGPAPGAVTLGVLPAGTGGDFRRMLRDSADLMTAAAALPAAASAPIDVGSLRFTRADGQPGARYFVNIASFGVAGLVDQLVNGSSKRLGGKVTFYLATMRAMAQYRPPLVRLTIDGQPAGEHRITNIGVCNGRFFGGGMMFAPNARLADGRFDVVVMAHAGLASTVGLTGSIYKGEHLSNPRFTVRQGSTVAAEAAEGGPVWLDIDGESPGYLPAEFALHPGAVRLLGARAETL